MVYLPEKLMSDGFAGQIRSKPDCRSAFPRRQGNNYYRTNFSLQLYRKERSQGILKVYENCHCEAFFTVPVSFGMPKQSPFLEMRLLQAGRTPAFAMTQYKVLSDFKKTVLLFYPRVDQLRI
jgi:hypothetical protein